MFREFFRFELAYWLRGWMIYIFVGVIAFLFGMAAGSDFVQIGGTVGNAYRNSPYTMALWYSAASILTCFMAAAIYDSSASRDFSNKMSDILFSKPLSKWGYLLGRFLGATCVAILPAVGISIGVLLARAYHGSDTEQWGPFHFWHHWQPFLVFSVPNTLLFGAVVFAIASVTRNTLFSFLGVLLLLVVYAITSGIVGQLDYEVLACLIDPFGSAPFGAATKYWTVSERNTLPIPLTPLMIANRLIWTAISLAIFFVVGSRFRFESTARARRKGTVTETVAEDPVPNAVAHEAVGLLMGTPKPAWWAQFASCLRSDLRAVVWSPAFIVILCFTLLNTGANLFLSDSAFYGTPSFPVTYKMIEQISGTLLIFPLAVITYYTGVLVWRDRDARLHEITGTTPTPNTVFVAARWTTMLVILLAILAGGMLLGVFYQWLQGYYRYQWDVYFWELIVITGARLGFLVVAGFAAHTLAPNKYVGYSVFVLFLVLNAQIWRWLRWDTLLVRFGALPGHTYSDMFGLAPYASGLLAFGVYWALVSLVVLWLCSLAMHRGVANGFAQRWREGWQDSRSGSRWCAALAGAGAVAMAGWLGYQTMVVNTLVGATEREQRSVDYEKTYKSLAGKAQPKIQSVRYAIDLFPESRNMVMRGEQTIANASSEPIEWLYLNVAERYDTEIQIPNASLDSEDPRLSFRTYRLNPPLLPGASLEMTFTVASRNRGIENQVSNAEIVQNGTFFNNGIAPSFGYSPNRRLVQPQRRKVYGLEPVESLPELVRECNEACQVHYIAEDSDWVSVESVISTSPDQIAIAPGSLVKEWQENGRNYFHYRVDHPSLNFYSFISARYEVKRDRVDGVETEVYYHRDHPWNVEKMSEAIADTLKYCNAEFGPYKHRQARIIEFPRIASFAQAFPGTMPYSESIGFIANLEKPDDVDMVRYVVAHEMGHQWWAHQVIGARMQGATLLSESLAQYTALMIMRQKYGDDMMHKFFRYEMDRYLRSRGVERRKERPLIAVELDQGYIHYQKGGLALYYLAEMIGEERINAALKEIIDQYAYRGPPYPNAYALVDRLRAQTPAELEYLIQDLFEDITLFGNRTLEATAVPLESGKYRVKIRVECEKFKADATGVETAVPMNDYLEIGAFAKPASGQRYGKLLHRERVQLEAGIHDLEFEVAELPHQAGIDPRHLLIDRVPDDNLKKVGVASADR